MADFLKAYALVKAWEGGWCDVPGDSGGETYAGIARNVWAGWRGWPLIDAAKKHSSFREGARAFSGHLAALPGLTDMVTDWYRVEWWDRMGLSRFPQPVADELFEQAVNLGRGGSGKLLQRILNAANYDRSTGRPLYADLAEDGAVGPKTLAALETAFEHLGIDGLIHALNAMQAAHYIGLAARKPAQRKFLAGWLTRTYDPQPME